VGRSEVRDQALDTGFVGCEWVGHRVPPSSPLASAATSSGVSDAK
jgi:hypothetical protein